MSQTGEPSKHQVPRGRYGSRERGTGAVQLLLERGVDIKAQDEDHMALTHLQSNFGQAPIVHAPLDHDANVNAGSSGSLNRESEGEYHIQCDSLCNTKRLTGASRRWTRQK